LQPDLVQAVAVIQLFLAKWYEPPRSGELDYSTLVQQVLSVVGECHGITAVVAYERLCQTGPFRGVTKGDFIALLRAMAAKKLLMQDANRLLLHGELGERLVNHYTFYAAFPDSQEYRLRQGGKDLGTLPLPTSNQLGDVITFAGRRWSIERIDHEKRLVDLQPSSMGKLPRTGGQGLPVHTKVREEMRAVLSSQDTPVWLDANARSLLQEARTQYLNLQLVREFCVMEGDTVYLFLWQGDVVQNSLVALLNHQGLQARNEGICIAVKHASLAMVTLAIAQVAAQPCPSAAQLFTRKDVPNTEKWDWVLPDELFLAGHTSRALDLEAAHALCIHLYETSAH
jgi:ATP-dependent Lhr-like helicase